MFKPGLTQIIKRHVSSGYNASKVARKYPVGAELHGFEVIGVLPVPELAFTAVQLNHKITGLEYLHVDRSDNNNVFSVCFKTNPTDSTGLPHILEHTTLCGSVKYPVRDPFFKMLNRSLANFMNAMTGHDYTFYPFSTTNVKDYENLRSIYCDAVFNPLLTTDDFYQEGWRLEHEDPKNKETPITFKGVVYNEMKGQFSNSSYLFYIRFLNSVYPSLHISGGDPKQITNLNHEDLVDFHSSRYHPSNAKVFSYGDIPLVNNLQFLNKSLEGFGRRPKSHSIRKPIELTSSKTVTVEGPFDPTLADDKQYKASLTWFLGHPEDVYGTFCMKLMSTLLLDGHSSLFYKQLIESGIGNDYSVNSGADSTTDLNSFTVGLQGLSEGDIEKFENIVTEILKNKAEVGFDDSKVEALLRQIELNKKDRKSDFGLNLLSGLIPGWVNNVKPFDYLAFEDIIEEFKINYRNSNGQFFQNLIKKYLIDKPVFKFVMKPNSEYENLVIAEESSRLNKKIEKLDESDKQVIYKRGLELLEEQSKEEDLSSLPTLSVQNDIPKQGENLKLDLSETQSHSSVERITDTNGLIYLRFQKNLNDIIPAELFPFLPLFSDCLLNLGTTNKSMDELEDQMKLYTGGLNSSIYVKPSINDNLQPNLFWEFRGVSLNSQVTKVLELWQEILMNVDFQNLEKLKTLIKSLNANSLSDITSSGHSYARSLVGSKLSPVKQLTEALNGVSQIKFIHQLNAFADDDALLNTHVVSKLLELRDIIISSGGFKVALIGDATTVENTRPMIDSFLAKLPILSITSNVSYRSPEFLQELSSNPNLLQLSAVNPTLINLPFQVSYASLGLVGSTYLTKDSASLQILSQLLTFKYLHREIREKGGAYGGGVRYGGVDGVFGYYSYRDPNPLRSIEYFKKSAEFAVETQWSEENLNEAKLTVFQGIDAPLDAKSEGMMFFRDRIDSSQRQQRRENLLDVSSEDVKNVAEKYLIKGINLDLLNQVAVIGPKTEDFLEKDWQIVNLST